MLLNLDDGTLSVYKNNRCLGVMKYGRSMGFQGRTAGPSVLMGMIQLQSKRPKDPERPMRWLCNFKGKSPMMTSEDCDNAELRRRIAELESVRDRKTQVGKRAASSTGRGFCVSGSMLEGHRR
ncbi:hypothetical protein THAOC_14004 [Thalassiosira oceanica]|uniref:Uncharacterized protein n=1 Tax=Thalassiosira oceanica TaxID=159749 RepID=K0SIP5_THAOC|nr:hypothetical protein THAOC_14004 [Thalassiosira oceanica]|eukprot:EJK65175.1 hypothetical protein THAOC_14004 [Thalassiosira oceanica]